MPDDRIKRGALHSALKLDQIHLRVLGCALVERPHPTFNVDVDILRGDNHPSDRIQELSRVRSATLENRSARQPNRWCAARRCDIVPNFGYSLSLLLTARLFSVCLVSVSCRGVFANDECIYLERVRSGKLGWDFLGARDFRRRSAEKTKFF